MTARLTPTTIVGVLVEPEAPTGVDLGDPSSTDAAKAAVVGRRSSGAVHAGAYAYGQSAEIGRGT